jgi:putative transcriptional regulator
MPRRKKTLLARDAKRNIGKELLQSIRDVKAGKHGARYRVAPVQPREPRLNR